MKNLNLKFKNIARGQFLWKDILLSILLASPISAVVGIYWFEILYRSTFMMVPYSLGFLLAWLSFLRSS